MPETIEFFNDTERNTRITKALIIEMFKKWDDLTKSLTESSTFPNHAGMPDKMEK